MNSMPRRSTRRRYSFWERIKVHPRRDREKIDALKTDMVRAFMKGDLETYWKLEPGAEMDTHPWKISVIARGEFLLEQDRCDRGSECSIERRYLLR
jgi:hypothetical protein